MRQYTLLNLGADFAFPKEQWPELANRIEDILNQQRSIFPIDSNIKQLAQSYTVRIIVSRPEIVSSESDDYREVDLDSLEMSRRHI